MLALVLWFVFGWRAGVAEVLAEAALGLALYGGGGGRRIRRTVRYFWAQTTRRRALAPA
ncbi:MAG: hypothetical protein ACTHNB_02715 [Gaiellaceae bacterium]